MGQIPRSWTCMGSMTGDYFYFIFEVTFSNIMHACMQF